jgi:hypothetical protein
MPITYVPPLDPTTIPEGCYAVWDDINLVWTFPPLSSLNPGTTEPLTP